MLARVAADHPTQIPEIDLASDEGRRLVEQAGVLFAPDLLVDGRPFGHGRISERKLRRTLTSLTQERTRS